MNQKQFVHWVGIKVLSIGEKIFQQSSIERAENIGQRLTKLLYKLDKKHRTRTQANIALAFPQLSLKEQQTMVEENYKHLGCVLADFLRTPIRTDEEVISSTEVIGREHLDRLVSEQKGILLVSAHLGNWERITQWFPLIGVKTSGVARDSNDSEITEKVSSIRSGRGMEILSRGNAAREILKRFKAGEMVAILPDQNADDAFIPFFGHIAGTVLGPAVIHRKTKSPILPACCLRTGPGTFKIHLLEPMTLNEGETNEEFMTRINNSIEKMIRLAPEQYLWMHDRWKNARKKGLL